MSEMVIWIGLILAFGAKSMGEREHRKLVRRVRAVFCVLRPGTFDCTLPTEESGIYPSTTSFELPFPEGQLCVLLFSVQAGMALLRLGPQKV